jgi:Leucine-rich repeat (LRR) protein
VSEEELEEIIEKAKVVNRKSNCLRTVPGYKLSQEELEKIIEQARVYQFPALDMSNNYLTTIPKSIGNLVNLKSLCLEGNPLTDLSSIKALPERCKVNFLNVDLPRRYWTKLNEWKSEWLLDEDNSEIRSILIKYVGYERICQELGTIELDK